jgi:hypothetical protein
VHICPIYNFVSWDSTAPGESGEQEETTQSER